jgi:glycosyl transferase/beta-hydroxylase protein BlmF
LERFIKSVASTATESARIEILIYVDEDDPEKFNYLVSHKNLTADPAVSRLLNIDLLVDEPLTTPLINNILADRAQGDILMIANDDQVYVDKNWDVRIDEEAAKFPDDIYCMWFNEGRYREKICTFPILSRKWVDTLGYIEPFLFEHFNCDLWTWQIGQMIDRLHYIPDILVEHLHPDTGKAAADETTERNLKGGRPERDKTIFTKFERYRVLDASLLKDVIEADKK